MLQKELGIYKQWLAQANANMATTVADLSIKVETLNANIETISKLRDIELERISGLEAKLIQARLSNSALTDTLAKTKPSKDLPLDGFCSAEFNDDLDVNNVRKREGAWTYERMPYSDVVLSVIDIFNDTYTPQGRNTFFDNLKTFN